MNPDVTYIDRIVSILRERRIVRYRDLINSGIPAFAVKRALSRGVIARFPDDINPVGLFLGNTLNSEYGDAERIIGVMAKHQKAVVWSLSAMKLHELIDRNSSDITTIIVPPGSNRSSRDPMVKISTSANPALLEVGVNEVDIYGFRVRVTNVWRTVIDAIRIGTSSSSGQISMEEVKSSVLDAVVHGRDGIIGHQALNRMAKYAIDLKYPSRVLGYLDAVAGFIDNRVVSDEGSSGPKL